MNFFTNKFSSVFLVVYSLLFLSACVGSSDYDFSETALLQSLANNAESKPLIVAPTNLNINQASGGLVPGVTADVYIGTLDIPYYFDIAESTSSFWDKTPSVREVLTVPVMLTLPNASSMQTMPAGGWPIVMYQHGITRNRTDVLAYADGLAQAGFAVIAIDLPTHGLTDTTLPFHADNTPFEDTEQTFGVDLRTQDENGVTTANIPDGKVDSSGTHFINLPSLLTSRDNFRQGVANLLVLRKSLGAMVDSSTGQTMPIDTSRVGFVAHSLGGMVGISYLGVETTPTPSSIIMAGATITQVLKNSPSFSPVIEQGLAGIGVVGTAAVDAFYADAQAVVNEADPAIYAETASAIHPIHLIEVLGDQTVPNSSTEFLAELMGATGVSSTMPVSVGNPGIVRFTEGSHSSPLDPSSSLAATVEIQRQLAAFQATNGTVISIFDPSVIQ